MTLRPVEVTIRDIVESQLELGIIAAEFPIPSSFVIMSNGRLASRYSKTITEVQGLLQGVDAVLLLCYLGSEGA